MKLYKRGYQNGAKTIEVIEGNLDVILYNENETTFYFYRFDPEDILGVKIPNTVSIFDQDKIERFLSKHGKPDYEGLINELILLAVSNGIEERYDV